MDQLKGSHMMMVVAEARRDVKVRSIFNQVVVNLFRAQNLDQIVGPLFDRLLQLPAIISRSKETLIFE